MPSFCCARNQPEIAKRNTSPLISENLWALRTSPPWCCRVRLHSVQAHTSPTLPYLSGKAKLVSVFALFASSKCEAKRTSCWWIDVLVQDSDRFRRGASRARKDMWWPRVNGSSASFSELISDASAFIHFNFSFFAPPPQWILIGHPSPNSQSTMLWHQIISNGTSEYNIKSSSIVLTLVPHRQTRHLRLRVVLLQGRGNLHEYMTYYICLFLFLYIEIWPAQIRPQFHFVQCYIIYWSIQSRCANYRKKSMRWQTVHS